MKYTLSKNCTIKRSNDGYFTIKIDGRRTSLKVGDMVISILQYIVKQKSCDEIIRAISRQYDISLDQADIYCSRIINELLSKEIICQTEEKGSLCKKIVYRDNDRLSRAVLIITNKCNFSCLHCDVDSGIATDKTKELSINHISSLLPYLVELGVDQIVITGGEPFLKPNFEKLLTQLSKYDFHVILYTNGSLISSKLCKLLSSIDNLRIQIPLDGVTPQTHEFLRRTPDAFKKAVRSINLLKEHGIRVSVGTVIYKQNLQEMRLFPKFLNDIGIQEWVVSVLMKIGRAISYNDIHLSDREFEEFLINFFWIQDNFPSLKILNNIFDSVASELIGSVCDIWEESITITPNGDVIPCERLPYLVLGNITKEKITEILQKEKIIKIQKEFINTLRELCRDCKYKELCGYGCPGVIVSNLVSSPCSSEIDPISCKFFRILDNNVILGSTIFRRGNK